MTAYQYKALAKCMIEIGLFDDILNKKGPAPQSEPTVKSPNQLYHNLPRNEQTRSDRDHARPPFSDRDFPPTTFSRLANGAGGNFLRREQ